MSHLEDDFERYAVRYYGLPRPEREVRFAPPRRFRFDFAFPEQRVAVELDGGTWTRGRHVTGAGFEKDCEKMNLATALGWRVLRFTAGMLERDPAGCMEQVRRLLEEGR